MSWPIEVCCTLSPLLLLVVAQVHPSATMSWPIKVCCTLFSLLLTRLTDTPPEQENHFLDSTDNHSTQHEAPNRHRSDSNVHISISIPACIAAMSDLNISLTPRPAHITTNRGVRNSDHRSQSVPVTPPVFRPIPAPLHMPPASPARHRPAPTPSPESPASRPAPLLEPIYPLRPGRHSIRHQYRLSQDRAHGYYVVFRGPKLGIFYTYWYVAGAPHDMVHSTSS